MFVGVVTEPGLYNKTTGLLCQILPTGDFGCSNWANYLIVGSGQNVLNWLLVCMQFGAKRCLFKNGKKDPQFRVETDKRGHIYI